MYIFELVECGRKLHEEYHQKETFELKHFSDRTLKTNIRYELDAKKT